MAIQTVCHSCDILPLNSKSLHEGLVLVAHPSPPCAWRALPIQHFFIQAPRLNNKLTLVTGMRIVLGHLELLSTICLVVWSGTHTSRPNLWFQTGYNHGLFQCFCCSPNLTMCCCHDITFVSCHYSKFFLFTLLCNRAFCNCV